MENILDIVKRAIFKEIIELTLLKRFTVILPVFKSLLFYKLLSFYKLYIFAIKHFSLN